MLRYALKQLLVNILQKIFNQTCIKLYPAEETSVKLVKMNGKLREMCRNFLDVTSFAAKNQLSRSLDLSLKPKDFLLFDYSCNCFVIL